MTEDNSWDWAVCVVILVPLVSVWLPAASCGPRADLCDGIKLLPVGRIFAERSFQKYQGDGENVQ